MRSFARFNSARNWNIEKNILTSLSYIIGEDRLLFSLLLGNLVILVLSVACRDVHLQHFLVHSHVHISYFYSHEQEQLSNIVTHYFIVLYWTFLVSHPKRITFKLLKKLQRRNSSLVKFS